MQVPMLNKCANPFGIARLADQASSIQPFHLHASADLFATVHILQSALWHLAHSYRRMGFRLEVRRDGYLAAARHSSLGMFGHFSS